MIVESILEKTTTIRFEKDCHGFLRQVDPQPFTYDQDYVKKQSTNPEMSWLRLGWLSAHISYEKLREFNVVDVGAGNGTFVREASSVFCRIVPYDVVGESITDEELYTTNWDLVCASDVIEHFQFVDHFFAIPFHYALLSFPETPPNTLPVQEWRHYKPNEHIYMLRSAEFRAWVEKNGCRVLAQGCPEDMIRRRWDPQEINISTFLIEKIK